MSDNAVFFGALGSGSSGNAFVIEYQDEAMIIDQGFSRKELLKRMECAGFMPDKLSCALLTHEHSDHCRGSRVFCDTLSLPLYTTAQTARYLSQHGTLPKQVRAFEAGAEFTHGSFNIKSFSISHDAVDPVGFQISCGNVRIGIATDFGYAPENIRRELRGCDVLVLESNYDREMLMNSSRSIELKRRIFGMRGHLGNSDSVQLLPDLIGDNTKLLLMAHISSECNTHELVRNNCLSLLQQMNIADKLKLEILQQDQPSTRFMLPVS